MSIEELLKPRIKVIERWPDMDKNKYYVGQIITLPCYERSSKQWFIQDEESKIYDAYFDSYPHLFKRLEWWQERDEKDMPEYLKYKSKIIKIDKWFYMANDLRFHSETTFITSGPYGSLPATREEYEQYLQSKK